MVRVALCGICILSGILLGQETRQAGSLTTWHNQVAPLVIVGEGWSQRIIVTNVDTSLPAIGTLSFYTRDGEPWSIDLTDKGAASTFLVNLLPGQTAIYETNVRDTPQELGWAILSLGTQGLGDVLAQTIFRKQTAGRPDFMTSAILSGQAFDKLTVFFDNTDGKYTGLGILTSEVCTFSCERENSFLVTIYDMDGNVIVQKTITQKPDVLYWMNLGLDFPETNGRTGTFTVQPVESFSSYLSGFSLQFASNGAFTAITPFED